MLSKFKNIDETRNIYYGFPKIILINYFLNPFQHLQFNSVHLHSIRHSCDANFELDKVLKQGLKITIIKKVLSHPIQLLGYI